MKLAMRMKRLLSKLRSSFRRKAESLQQSGSLLVSSVILAAILGAILSLEAGWLSWSFTVPAHLTIIITALARVKDLKDMNKRSHVRRIGLAMTGAGSAVFLMAPFVISIGDFPTWKAVLLVWGVALTWITTPSQPPWWKYITGEYRGNVE